MGSTWAKRAVEKMSADEVEFWIRRLYPESPLLPENQDRRSPIERLIDDATGKAKDPAPPEPKQD